MPVGMGQFKEYSATFDAFRRPKRLGGTVPNPNVTNVTRKRGLRDCNISREMWLNQNMETENFLSQL